ncbi:zinc finger protein 449-like [Polyodon spathula]|uniref:zinc finger protein 449-like n=1 Tax=Polyodon spathula TaxID=7913 RepID=UPI001B7EEFBB|nr:zinc finger protein 449-like [Polyodon spathula]
MRFQEYRRPRETDPRVVVQKLWDHMVHWLNPAQKTGAQMGEAMVLEQFCHVVGTDTQDWVRLHNPDTLEAAIKLAEDFEDARASIKTGLLTRLPPLTSRGAAPAAAPPLTPLPLGPRPAKTPIPMGRPSSSPWLAPVGVDLLPQPTALSAAGQTANPSAFCPDHLF